MTIDGVTKSYSVSANVTSWSGNVTSNLLQTSGTRTITVKVTDKRGYSGTYTTTISVTAYSNPTISAASGESKVIIERSDSGGTADPAGDCLHLKFIRKISAITNNTGYVSYKVGSGTATTISTSTTGSVTIDQTLNLSWSEHNTYQVTVRIWDSVGYEVTRTVTIPSLNVTLDLRQGGLGVGVGMFSQGNNRFDEAWDAWLYGLTRPKTIRNFNTNATYATDVIIVPRYTVADLGMSSVSFPYDDYWKAWLKRLCQDYSTASNYTLFIGGASPNSTGIAYAFIGSVSSLTDGLPNLSDGFYIYSGSDTNEAMVRFGTNGGVFRTRAFFANDTEVGTVAYVTNSLVAEADASHGLRKSGKVVTLRFSITPSGTSGGTSWVTIGTIQSGFRPSYYVYQNAASLNSTGQSWIRVDSSGNLQLYKNNTSTAAVRCEMTWILD